jgi:hypothetical protein
MAESKIIIRMSKVEIYNKSNKYKVIINNDKS